MSLAIAGSANAAPTVPRSEIADPEAFIAKVDARTGGTPDVELFLWAPAHLLGKAGDFWQVFQKYGHVSMAVRKPGQEPIVYDINSEGKLVSEYTRGEYLYGIKPEAPWLNAANREVRSVRWHGAAPRGIARAVAYWAGVGQRNAKGEAAYAVLFADVHNAVEGASKALLGASHDAPRCEHGNCAQWTNRALAAGEMLAPGQESQWPLQLVSRFIQEHRDEVTVIRWEQKNERPLRIKKTPWYAGRRDPAPKEDFVVRIDPATGEAGITEADPSKPVTYRPRFAKAPWTANVGRSAAWVARAATHAATKLEARRDEAPVRAASRFGLATSARTR